MFILVGKSAVPITSVCRLKWALTHVIGLHVKLTILGDCDVAATNILGLLISNIVLMLDTRAH